MARNPAHKNKETYRPGAWLNWVGLLILLAGGLLTYLFYTKGHGAKAMMSLCGALTIVGSGIFFICANASFWIKR